MNGFTGIVLYAVIWFMTVFVVLPIRLRTQADEGRVVPGTHQGAPAEFRVGRLMLVVTIWATLIWAAVAGVILFGGLTVADIDFFNRMAPRPVTGG
jgi:predicted secreted protein